MSNIEGKITQTITDLIDDFELHPGKYLTENDVRCILFKKLMEHQEFNQLQETEDGSCSIPLHTEVRWYGKSGKLKWRSDIVILDVSTLRVKNGIFRLPSKGYSFNKPLAIVEIKLRRINGHSDNAFIKKILEDVDKLEEIKRELSGDYYRYLIILDKKKSIEQTIQISYSEDGIKLFYKHSNNNHQTMRSQRISAPNRPDGL